MVIDTVDGLKRNFNPRPPRGGRPRWIITHTKTIAISIHAPREGGDSGWNV